MLSGPWWIGSCHPGSHASTGATQRGGAAPPREPTLTGQAWSAPRKEAILAGETRGNATRVIETDQSRPEGRCRPALTPVIWLCMARQRRGPRRHGTTVSRSNQTQCGVWMDDGTRVCATVGHPTACGASNCGSFQGHYWEGNCFCIKWWLQSTMQWLIDISLGGQVKKKTLHQNWTNAFWEVIGEMKFIGQENVQRSQWTIFQVGMLAHGHCD